MEYKCNYCNGVYTAYPSMKQKYCSISCSTKAVWPGRKHKPETIEKMTRCKIDLDEISEQYISGKTLKQLGEKYGVAKATIKRKLLKNGVKLRKGGTRKGTKSPKKGKPQLSTRGKNNNRWKGGITTLNQQIRHCVEYKLWRSNIFEREDWTCKFCKKRGGWLEVDHYPKGFAEIMSEYKIDTYEKAQQCKELWNEENGRVLCKKCHSSSSK